MPDIASVPLAYYNIDYDSYGYKTGILIRFMQNHAVLLRDNPEYFRQMFWIIIITT